MDFDGSIIINDEIKLHKGFTLTDFKKTYLYSNQDTSRFFWISDKCKVFGYKFILGLWFNGNYLKQIQLYCDEDYIKDEEQRKQFHNELLKKITDSRHFIWGSIESVFDNKTFESVIAINYKY